MLFSAVGVAGQEMRTPVEIQYMAEVAGEAETEAPRHHQVGLLFSVDPVGMAAARWAVRRPGPNPEAAGVAATAAQTPPRYALGVRVELASSSSRRFNSGLKLDGRDGKSQRTVDFRNLPGLGRGSHWSRSHGIERPDFHNGWYDHVDQSRFWDQNSH